MQPHNHRRGAKAMSDFVWPSDSHRAENRELDRVCDYLEDTLDKLDALRATNSDLLALYESTRVELGKARARVAELEWSLAIDRIVPDLSPEPDQNEYPAEWSVWADRQRVRRELSLLSAPPSAMVMINEKPIQRRPSYGGFNMEDQVIEKKIDDSRSAKVTWNEYGCQLLTLNNGRQWSGAAIYSVEVAEAAIEVLKAYVKQQKGANNGGGKRKMMFDDMQIERVARAICTACGEDPDHSGDCRGNDFRWQDYREAAMAAIRAVFDNTGECE
jgi:hypothetical protein